MRNYKGDGNLIALTTPAAIATGAGLLVGGFFGITCKPAGAGEVVECLRAGEFTVVKNSAEAWAVGDTIYWDDTAKLFTAVVASNKQVGFAAAVAANPSATGIVQLVPMAGNVARFGFTGGNVTGLIKPDNTTYGLILGPVLYSALPAAASYSGYMCKVSDVGGSTGSLWISDGVRWKPVNGALTLYSSDAQSAAVSGVTETIQSQILLPAGLLHVGDRLVCKLSQSKSSTSETATTRIRLGTAGTVSDTQIAAIAAMTTTLVSVGWTFDMRVNSATTVQKMGGASTALPWGTSTGAFPAATTVSSVTANALYLSFSSFMSSTVETTRIEDLVIELHTTTA